MTDTTSNDPRLKDMLNNLDKEMQAHPVGNISYAPKPKVIESTGNGASPVGEKTGEAIVQYAERAAEFIVTTTNELRSIAEQWKLESQRNMEEVDGIVKKYCEGSEKFAQLLRERATEEADRNVAFTKKLHAAGVMHGDARKIFDDNN
jgi:hypothetical protein